MTQQRTVDKETFFHYPGTMKEIVANRRIVEHAGTSLLEAVLHLEEGEALLTEQLLVPSTYRHAQNFLKRGPEVYLGAPKTLQEAVREKRGPGRRRLAAFERVRDLDLKCGYVWTSLRDGKRRKVHLVDCLEGAKIFFYSHQTEDPDEEIKIKAYTDVRNANNVGGTFDCRAPSRSREGNYQFLFHAVPLLGSDEQHFVWTHLHTSGHGGNVHNKGGHHGCGSRTYDPLNFRSVSGEETFCPHEIAAYLEISRQAGKDQERKIMLQPFALPTPATVSFYKRLREQVVVHDARKDRSTGKTRRIHRPFNEAEIEILLWQFTAQRGYLDTWYADPNKGQRLSLYEWG